MADFNGVHAMVKPGDAVVLRVPDNQFLHGVRAVVVELADWGAHVSTSVGSGRFRAAWDEMVKVPPGTTARPAVKFAGYTGDVCDRCGSSRMRRSGTCLVCDCCGDTSGCG